MLTTKSTLSIPEARGFGGVAPEPFTLTAAIDEEVASPPSRLRPTSRLSSRTRRPSTLVSGLAQAVVALLVVATLGWLLLRAVQALVSLLTWPTVSPRPEAVEVRRRVAPEPEWPQAVPEYRRLVESDLGVAEAIPPGR